MTSLTISIDADRVEIHGTTKGDAAQRAAITRPWVWSRSSTAWVLPRSLRPETREYAIRRVQRALQDAGFVVEVEDSGHRLSVAEEREARAERLENRADRHENRAERKEAESEALHAYSDRLVEHIPPGQPILVGHYSERGHRRTLERSRNAMFRAIEASAESREAERKATGLRRALERGTPMVTLRNRIDRLEADVRRYTKKIDGAGRPIHGQDKPATGGYRERLLALRARAEEELDLDRAELAAREEKGVKVWRPEDFKPRDRVIYRFGTREVVRVNPKTLSIKTDYSWLDKLPYQEVQGRISAEQWGAAEAEPVSE
jgi:hypothetical protein